MKKLVLLAVLNCFVLLWVVGTSVADPDLVVYYSFDKLDGNNVPDMSGNGHDGAIKGDITLADGKNGLAGKFTTDSFLDLDGANFPAKDIPTSAFSLCAWINCENTGQDHAIFNARSSDETWLIHPDIRSGGQYRFCLRGSGSNKISDIKSGTVVWDEWIHYAGTYDRSAGKVTLYINGEVAGTGQTEVDFSGWNPHTFKLSLCNSLGFENGWTGKLFLTTIYNRALAEDEVRQNYSAGKENLSIPPEVPGQPGKLSSTPLSAVATILHWEDLSQNETGFVLERKAAEGGFHYVATVPGDVTEYIDEDLVANSSYTYRIKALNDYGESLYSGESRSKTLSDDLLENVALLKTATQSSTTYKGRPSKGVDGNRDGIYINKSVTHTAYELNAWWEVDLEEIYYLDHMEVWNRTDPCCKDRMARFYIFISEDPFTSHDFQTTLDQPGVTAIYREFFPDPMITVNVAQRGRYIRLQLSDSQNINLAELVVMGSTPDNP